MTISVAEWIRRITRRRRTARLLELDDHLLNDIGVSRSQLLATVRGHVRH
jgi:uncharacterized protein YjiS (DUF1127 family)